MGFGEGRALILGKRNPSGHRTLTKETQIIGNVSTYATRQSEQEDRRRRRRDLRLPLRTSATSPASWRGTCATAARSSSRPRQGGRADIKTGDTNGRAVHDQRDRASRPA
jgi:hypothetical protein